jgi:hypothetical protein
MTDKTQPIFKFSTAWYDPNSGFPLKIKVTIQWQFALFEPA